MPPIEDNPQRQTQSPAVPETVNRRGALSKIAKTVASIVAFVMSEEFFRRPLPNRATSVAPTKKEAVSQPTTDIKELDENELTQHRIQAFKLAVSALKRNQILLLDQNANIITGGPIEIPAEVEAKLEEYNRQIKAAKSREQRETLNAEKKKFYQNWLDGVRVNLKKQYPWIELEINPKDEDAKNPKQKNGKAEKPNSKPKNMEKPELVSARALLITTPEHETRFPFIYGKSQEIITAKDGTKISKYDLIKRIFAGSGLPAELQAMMPGLVAQESQYDDNAESNAEAVGAWQMLAGTAGQFGAIYKKTTRTRRGRKIIKETVTVDNRRNFEESAKAAVRYFEDAYRQIKGSRAYANIARTYSLTDEDLLFPCMINAYNAGTSRIIGMIEWFAREYTPEKVKGLLGSPPYGKDIFSLMSNEYMRASTEKQVKDTRYGKDCRNYYAWVAAMTELLEKPSEVPPDFPENYVDPAAPGLHPQEETQNIALPAGAIAISTAVGATLAMAADEIIANEPTNRREFFKTLGTLGKSAGAAAIGAAAGKVLRPPSVPRVEPAPPQKPSTNPAEAALAQDAISQQLIKENVRLKTRLLTDEESKTLRTKYKNPRLKRWAREQGFQPVKDINDLDAAAIRFGFVQLPERAASYRLCGVGNLGSSDKNNTKYARVYPHTVQLIEDISQRVNAAAHKAGLPAKYSIRLIVTSAARTEAFQKLLQTRNPNAAEWSAHTLGNSIDINWRRFDIIDSETNKFAEISANDDLNKELKLATLIKSILGRVVMEVMNENKAMGMQEMDKPVFHLMATGM